jgi:DNA-directed RNA polymerase beta subunit
MKYLIKLINQMTIKSSSILNKKKYLQNLIFNPWECKGIEYSLETFHRSNQDTCLLHNPSAFENDWVESGDLLADCAASSGGELSLGKNILVAYMPWEGYNYEDAILISERLVYEDVYSSIHIERYDIETRETKFGNETITRNIPELNKKELQHLDSKGVAKLGSWIKEGDILVGRVTPINKKSESTYKNLLYTILDKSISLVRDSSLRAPKGIKAKVINIQIYLKLFPMAAPTPINEGFYATHKESYSKKEESFSTDVSVPQADSKIQISKSLKNKKSNINLSMGVGTPIGKNNIFLYIDQIIIFL